MKSEDEFLVMEDGNIYSLVEKYLSVSLQDVRYTPITCWPQPSWQRQASCLLSQAIMQTMDEGLQRPTL